MAKQPEAPKMRWYQTLWQAYKVTARVDKPLPYLLIAAFAVPVIAGVVFALLQSGLSAKIYGPMTGVLVGTLATMLLLTRRFESAMFKQMSGALGGSLAVAQNIRTGWTFAEEPIAVDPKAKSVIFQGVGNGGVVLLVEGGNAARKTVDQAKSRISKLVPGVPVSAIYVGTHDGEVPLKSLTKTIKATKRTHYGRGIGKGLSTREAETVRARLKAIGGASLPVPKGIDPTKARADRKALKGR